MKKILSTIAVIIFTASIAFAAGEAVKGEKPAKVTEQKEAKDKTTKKKALKAKAGKKVVKENKKEGEVEKK